MAGYERPNNEAVGKEATDYSERLLRSKVASVAWTSGSVTAFLGLAAVGNLVRLHVALMAYTVERERAAYSLVYSFLGRKPSSKPGQAVLFRGSGKCSRISYLFGFAKANWLYAEADVASCMLPLYVHRHMRFHRYVTLHKEQMNIVMPPNGIGKIGGTGMSARIDYLRCHDCSTEFRRATGKNMAGQSRPIPCHSCFLNCFNHCILKARICQPTMTDCCCRDEVRCNPLSTVLFYYRDRSGWCQRQL